MGSGARLTLELTERSAELKPAEWDSLVGEAPLATWGWLQATERTHRFGLEPRYFLVRDGAVPRAAAVCYRSSTSSAVFTLDDQLLGPARGLAPRLGISSLPALSCAPVGCVGQHLFLARGLAPGEAEQVSEFLLDRIEGHARQNGLAMGFTGLDVTEIDLLRRLEGRGYLMLPSGTHSVLDIRWSSFEEYLDHLRTRSKRVPKNIRYGIRRNLREGVQLRRIGDASRYRDELHALADSHYRRLNQKLFPFRPDLFEQLQAHLGSDVNLIGAFKAGALIGFSLSVQRGNVEYKKFIGIDRKRSGNDGTFFQLAYNWTIREAIARGARRIDFGKSLADLKARRGCQTRTTLTAYRARTSAGRGLSRAWVGELQRLRALRRRPDHEKSSSQARHVE